MAESIYQKIRWQFILWLARRLPDCKTITPKLGESIDRRLTVRERIVNRLHLFTCEACQRYLEQIKFLKEAAHIHDERVRTESAGRPHTLSDDARERLRSALRSKVEGSTQP